MSHRRRRRGFVLVLAAVSSIVMIACAGLALDIGRMYVVRNELQTFADAAAMDGTLQLDATAAGFTRAQAAVTTAAAQMKWNLGTTAVAAPTVEFANNGAGPWSAAPGAAAGYGHTRIAASASMPLVFLPALVGKNSSLVNAVAAAGQLDRGQVPQGTLPFSPGAHNNTPPMYGFVRGQLYALRWGNHGDCAGDAGYTPGSVGYWGSTSTSELRDRVLEGVGSPVSKGDSLLTDNGHLTTGQKQAIINSLQERIGLDTDTTSPTFARYASGAAGNGKRVVAVPINIDGTVVAFAGFFLLPASQYDGTGQTAACAEFIGSYLQGANRPGSAPIGYLEVRLTQ